MALQTISTKQLREDFARLRTAIEAGQPLLLLYRSQPLAKILPIAQPKKQTRLFSKQQMKQWIVDDQLTVKEEKQIDAIIKNLP